MTPTKKLSFATTHPDLALEADGWDPTTVTAGSHKKVGWKCGLGHQWEAEVQKRTSGSGCPVCAGRNVLAGFNDLATVNPGLAEQADGWDPTTVTSWARKKVGWKCGLGHQWEAAVSSRSRGSGCPVCSGQAVLAGFNDLATINPEIAAQADGWDPSAITAGSGKMVGWKCGLGHQWEAVVAKRTSVDFCPVCSGQAVLVGFNDLATVNPEIAAQADGWDPTTLTVGSGKKVDWICELGHQFKARVVDRSNGVGCPVCAGRNVLAGFNDLATVNPGLAEQADGWDPTTATAGSHKIVGWKCGLGHVWKAQLKSRVDGNGCPVCVGQAVLVGFNDLATVNPGLAAQADGWDPKTITPGTDKKFDWICELGHQWKASVSSRTAGRGCPSCAVSGFDPNKPSFLYLIDHFDLDMYQIGITNFPDDRLGKHERSGWEVLELRGPMDGHLTQQLEKSCLHALEKRGAILGHKIGIDKFDGYSEAWTKSSLNVTSIKQMLDWVYEDE